MTCKKTIYEKLGKMSSVESLKNERENKQFI